MVNSPTPPPLPKTITDFYTLLDVVQNPGKYRQLLDQIRDTHQLTSGAIETAHKEMANLQDVARDTLRTAGLRAPHQC